MLQKLCLLALCLAYPLLNASDVSSAVTTGAVTIAYDLADHRLPKWSNGALIAIANNGTANPVIHVFGADGHELAPTVFQIPGTTRMLIEEAAHAKDGRIVLCGVAYSESGSGGGFIASFLPGSREAMIVRTAPYSPYLVTVADNGTIWTEGIEMVNGVEAHPLVNRGNGVIRGFDLSGKTVHSFVPRATLNDGAGGLCGGLLASSNDRVGWYMKESGYIEMRLDGAVTRYSGIPDLKGGHATGVAMTQDGRVFVEGTTSSPRKALVFTLDRANNVWHAVNFPGRGVPPVLYGAEGQKLVVMGASRYELAFFEVH